MDYATPIDAPIQHLPATRSATIQQLNKLGIRSLRDLLNHLPRRYEDRSTISSIARLQPGEKVTVQGSIRSTKNQFARNGLTIQTATIADASGEIELVWFNQRYLSRVLMTGRQLSVWGEVREYRGKTVLFPQEFETITPDAQPFHTGTLTPIYPETGRLSSKTIREKMRYAISILRDTPDSAFEFLPERILETYGLLNEKEALIAVHHPTSPEDIRQSRHRLGYDELFILQLASQLTRQHWDQDRVGNSFRVEPYESNLRSFIDRLPFVLTEAQEKAIREIVNDLAQDKPMNRFLQGDVGSGKTAVAAVAAYLAHLNKFETLIMAPTEILAQQHYSTFSKLFETYNVPIQFISGSSKKSDELVAQSGITIGTHALLTRKKTMKTVGLVVIDEQHRFGVMQRAELKNKGSNPHLLTMTATPIPRTVALTIFGELDMSILNELPKNRLPIKSWVVAQQKRADAYRWIDEQVETGSRVYIICPLIDESETESLASTRAAQTEYERLRSEIFPHRSVGLLHGRMKSPEKSSVMEQFATGNIQILVATSVVEVGIDVPEATIILIEGAERFGLAQLHQLRGRVGRGAQQSYCLLFPSDTVPHTSPRLNFFAQHSKGSDIAEFDLMSRGVGELYGTKQHGYTELKVASLADQTLIQQTREGVSLFLKNHQLEEYPLLQKKIEGRMVARIAKD